MVGTGFEAGTATRKDVLGKPLNEIVVRWFEIPVVTMVRSKKSYDALIPRFLFTTLGDCKGDGFRVDLEQKGATGMVQHEMYIPGTTYGVLLYFFVKLL